MRLAQQSLARVLQECYLMTIGSQVKYKEKIPLEDLCLITQHLSKLPVICICKLFFFFCMIETSYGEILKNSN